VCIAAAVMLAICVWRGYSFPRRAKDILLAAILGFFTAAMPSLLGLWGIQSTEVSLASVILATQPFLVAILAHRLLPNDRLNTQKVLGLTVGFFGVGLISLDKSGGSGANSQWGQIALVGSALSVAISAVLGKYLSPRWEIMPFTAVQTAGGAVFILVAVLLFELGAPVQLTVSGLAATLYLALGPTVLGYFLWMLLIDRYSASGVSSFAFFQPAFGIVLGWLLFAEGFSVLTVVGTALITWSVLTVNRRG
jgi:drug/metabolite transporter (DMT)-like permease